MKMTAALIALFLAVPAAAQAQAAPAPGERPKMECCCKDMAKPMACCERHGKPGQDEHEQHDMGQPQR